MAESDIEDAVAIGGVPVPVRRQGRAQAPARALRARVAPQGGRPAGEVFPFRQVKIQRDQGRGGVRIQVPCTSLPFLLILTFLLLNYRFSLKQKLLIGFIESQTNLLWNLNR